MMPAGCTAGRDGTEKDTVSLGSITESETTDGLLRPWNIRKTSIFRRFHASAK